MRKRYNNRRINGLFVFILLVIFIVLFIIIDSHVRPLINSSAKQRAETVVNKIINDTVADIIEKNNIDYDDIITIVYDDDNNVKSIESDTIKINKMKAEINSAIISVVSKYNNGKLKIRIGTLIGSSYTMGRGPNLTFKFDLVSTVNSTFKDDFMSVGINQTKHQLILEVTTNVTVLIPWYNTTSSFTTEILIDESIIVGSVPDSYTDIDIGSGTLYNIGTTEAKK